MRYIGPFFRMNSLSQQEIDSQLFFFAKEALKTIVLESKDGITSSIKNFKSSFTNIDITTISNFSPLLCIYKKASHNYLHSKNSNGFDEDSFKKEINPITNALMSLSLMELCDYYTYFENIDKNNYVLFQLYKNLSKEQLEFFSVNLRNSEGTFASKRNLLENNIKSFNLVDKDKKFKFSDQSFMMLAYYTYYYKNKNDKLSEAYKSFSLEILQMHLDFKDKIYESSLEEICKVLLSLNMLFNYYKNEELRDLIVDLSDYLMNKFDDKDYYVDSLDMACFCSMILTLTYRNTGLSNFIDKSKLIIDKLSSFFDSDKEIFLKLSAKKEIKYSCLDVNFYFMAFLLYSKETNNEDTYKNLLSSIYKKLFISSGLITSWPDSPTLDDYERYRGFTLNSNDMIDESYFRMPNIPSPKSNGIAPIFNKSIIYNKRKNTFSQGKNVFDSYKNFLIFYLYIILFKDECINDMNLRPLNIFSTSAPIIEAVTPQYSLGQLDVGLPCVDTSGNQLPGSISSDVPCSNDDNLNLSPEEDVISIDPIE